MTSNIVRHYAALVDEILDDQDEKCRQCEMRKSLTQLFKGAIIPSKNNDLLDNLNVYVVQSTP